MCGRRIVRAWIDSIDKNLSEANGFLLTTKVLICFPLFVFQKVSPVFSNITLTFLEVICIHYNYSMTSKTNEQINFIESSRSTRLKTGLYDF
jgi:hypothetical protein